MRYITTKADIGVKNRFAGCSAIGHNWLLWMVGPIISQRYGLQYVYQPFPEYNNSQSWNKFLGFSKQVPSALNGLGIPSYNIEDIQNDVETIHIPKLPWDTTWDHPTLKKMIGNNYRDNVLFITSVGQGISLDWCYYLNNDLKEKYEYARQENPVVSLNYPTFINVGIHIRRGDINPIDQPERWISNNQYIKLMQNIYSIFGDNCLFHIYSEGEDKDFKDIFEKFGLSTELHLNTEPMITFHNLVMSDILINAKSAFSVLAAYLHRGPKLCIPFSIYWQQTHPDNDNFKDLIWVNDNMDFDNEKIKSCFS